MEQNIDALRVVQDPQYAASLSESEWRILANDPVWNELVGEFHEMTAPVVALYAAPLGQAATRPRAARPPAARRAPAAAGEPPRFDVIGERVPRHHGPGVVTYLGR